MSTTRLYRLAPWVVRALIPTRVIGTYVLYIQGKANYIGRSDTCIRRRLLHHCGTARGEYFTYDVHASPEQAFAGECSLFHALRRQLTNIRHPDRPDFTQTVCPFCWSTLQATRQHRLSMPVLRSPQDAKEKR